jgi:hypothetical protein
MSFVNPTLRDPGSTPGSAKGWTIASLCQAQRLAAFAPAPARAAEDFERWSDFQATFPDGSLVLAFFDVAPEGYEDFEEGWTPSAFISEFSDALLDTCSFGGSSVEDMETGWLTGAFVRMWSDVVGAPALFGGGAVEDFEAWLAPAAISFASATFDGGSKSAETFEGAWTAMKTL